MMRFKNNSHQGIAALILHHASFFAILLSLASSLAILGLIRNTAAARDLSDHISGQFIQPITVGGVLEQSANYPNCRFGVGGNISGYDVAELNIGWSIDWSARLNPNQPNGADYVQMVRLMPDLVTGYSFTPETQTLQMIMDQNPGSIWLIGNEADSPFQDDVLPEVYARAYHHLYYLIKTYDPSARIGTGGIVQATPLRFQYLDRVLDTYRQLYGERLPADLWNIHSYILREIDASDPEAFPNGPYEVWGAYIPPGIAATRGILYTYSDMFNLEIFKQRLLDFRTWMRDRGDRDKPLYITEYGELFPYPPDISPPPYQDENGVDITSERVASFMTSTFDILLNETDDAVGYPADANRLVQRWTWYSVGDVSFGGALFDPVSRERRPLGDVFYTYTQNISPSVDLFAVSTTADPAVIVDTGQLHTTTLRA